MAEAFLVAELSVVRHGESVSNAAYAEANARGLHDAGITGRDADVGLTARGRAQAAALGRWLATLNPPHAVITSPYRRAQDTWRIAVEAGHLPVRDAATDDRLVDRLMGRLELMTEAAIAARYPAEAARRREVGEFAYRPPGGESFVEVAARLTSFLEDLHRTHTGRRVIVVAHDAVVLMIRSVVDGLGWEEVASIAANSPVRNASITRFDGSSGRLVLTDYNAVGHLPAGVTG